MKVNHPSLGTSFSRAGRVAHSRTLFCQTNIMPTAFDLSHLPYLTAAALQREWALDSPKRSRSSIPSKFWATVTDPELPTFHFCGEQPTEQLSLLSFLPSAVNIEWWRNRARTSLKALPLQIDQHMMHLLACGPPEFSPWPSKWSPGHSWE